MPDKPSFWNRQRALLFTALVIFFCSLYTLTYSGNPLSGDELFLFNATASQLHYGDSLLDITAGNNRPLAFDTEQPLNSVVADPMQIWLSMPLYWLAEQISGIGLVHTVWLFNVLVTALAVGVFFLFALTLGYSERASVLASLALGMGTILWPYSKTFFNEPLLLLLLLLCSLLFERWRQRGYRAYRLIIAALLVFGMAYLTKAAAVLALPGLIMLVMPVDQLHRWRWGRRALRGVDAVIIFGFIAVVFVLYVDPRFLREHLFPLYSLTGGGPGILRRALQGYFFSIGGSFWGTSPVLLLALPGVWLLYGRQQHRLIYGLLTMIVGFGVGYAVLRGAPWFGGLSWPPRFLVPIIPFAMLLTMPAFERLVTRPRLMWGWLLFAVIMGYAIWVQLSGVTLSWTVYPLLLPPEANGFLEWSGGLNAVQYLRWVLIPQAWHQYPLDIAWLRVNTPVWALALLAVLLCAALSLKQLLAMNVEASPPRHKRAILGLVALYVAVLSVGLRLIYPDPLFNGDNTTLHELLPVIRAEMTADDVLLLSNRAYASFFLNYGKHLPPRIIGLPDAPGEQPSPEQPPLTTSPNTEALMEKQTPPLMHHLAARHDRLWLLVNAGPFIPWSIRPEEGYLTTHYFPVRTFTQSPTVRLIEFSTTDAPDQYAFRAAEITTDLRYGDALALLGYELPNGTTYTSGAVLPIALYWQTQSPLPADYTIAVKLATADGVVVAGAEDSYPVGGFLPTTRWQPNTPVWDNRALRLPQDLAAGDYRLWVIVYDGSSGTAQNLPVIGAEVREGSFGVLPTIITVG